jgi:hypothetical protein
MATLIEQVFKIRVWPGACASRGCDVGAGVGLGRSLHSGGKPLVGWVIAAPDLAGCERARARFGRERAASMIDFRSVDLAVTLPTRSRRPDDA